MDGTDGTPVYKGQANCPLDEPPDPGEQQRYVIETELLPPVPDELQWRFPQRTCMCRFLRWWLLRGACQAAVEDFSGQ